MKKTVNLCVNEKLMNEDFLQFIWRFGLFNKDSAKTTDNQNITILNLGIINKDSGPDFFNAKVKIGKIIWAGNIEIHINASDWKRHKHNHDKSYDNVILHVVKNADCDIFRSDGSKIPIFKIQYDSTLEKRYDELLASKTWIACQNYISDMELFKVKHFLSRMMVERLEQRSSHINKILADTKNDFKEVFYRLLFRSFGFGTNTLPFELLAQSTPIVAINKHRDSVFQMEALLFGQAGFLNEAPVDDYQSQLQKEYKFLQNKFELKPVEKHLWKFMRLRPTNFPTVRIAQLAKFLTQTDGLLAKIMASEKPDELNSFFEFSASEYWDTHYNFGKSTNKRIKSFGKKSAEKIIINLVAPYLFAYGKAKGEERFSEKAFDLLEIIPPEKNNIITGWKNAGVKIENAFYSQSLIQLKTAYCDNKQCLKCVIGKNIIDKK
ncbi:MAG: DUF2851 family protein [Prevotellaceae bacterium]|jgi:hypothetical protein|nr:DUF2851 family protein [Prevotellaceae bacterium]